MRHGWERIARESDAKSNDCQRQVVVGIIARGRPFALALKGQSCLFAEFTYCKY